MPKPGSLSHDDVFGAPPGPADDALAARRSIGRTSAASRPSGEVSLIIAPTPTPSVPPSADTSRAGQAWEDYVDAGTPHRPSAHPAPLQATPLQATPRPRGSAGLVSTALRYVNPFAMPTAADDYDRRSNTGTPRPSRLSALNPWAMPTAADEYDRRRSLSATPNLRGAPLAATPLAATPAMAAPPPTPNDGTVRGVSLSLAERLRRSFTTDVSDDELPLPEHRRSSERPPSPAVAAKDTGASPVPRAPAVPPSAKKSGEAVVAPGKAHPAALPKAAEALRRELSTGGGVATVAQLRVALGAMGEPIPAGTRKDDLLALFREKSGTVVASKAGSKAGSKARGSSLQQAAGPQ